MISVKKHLRKKKNGVSVVKKHNRKAKNNKVKKVMSEFKKGQLHSGSKKGPIVKDRKQAIAIALSEQQKHNKK